jgi:hypothetical protein
MSEDQFFQVKVKCYSRPFIKHSIPKRRIKNWKLWGGFIYIVSQEGFAILCDGFKDTEEDRIVVGKMESVCIGDLTLYQQYKAQDEVAKQGYYRLSCTQK